MTPRYRTAFSVPSGFAATTPATETKAQKSVANVRGKVAAGTRAASVKAQRTDAPSDRRGSAAA